MLSLKKIILSVYTILLVVLAVSTIFVKISGFEETETMIYSSFPFLLLWFLTALVSALWIFRRKLFRRKLLFAFHLSFFFILLGALMTWMTGIRGVITLSPEIRSDKYITTDEQENVFPFYITLESFRTEYYTGTDAPMDYISKIRITDGVENISGTVSMNNIFRYRNYRFYQGDFDNRNNEVYLLVSYDPYGIFFTYLGYLIFLITFPMFILIKKHSFSLSFGIPVLRRAAVSITMLLYCFNAGAADKPKVLPQHLAEEFCDISVLYNDRVCPLQTLARDFTVKLYGKDSYKGYSAEQVMTGWMFFYQSWKSLPMIEIKSNRVRDILGTDERYVSYSQFISPLNEYKLASDKHTLPFSETAPANEKFNLIKNLCSGRMLRIFPLNDEADNLKWISAADMLPSDISDDKWYFIKKSQDYLHETLVMKDYEKASEIISGIRKFQNKETSVYNGLQTRLKAEKVYNGLHYFFPLSLILIIAGFLLFFYFIKEMVSGNHTSGIITGGAVALIVSAVLYLITLIGLRWYIGGHVPVANGFETMQFMALSILIITLLSCRRFRMIISFGIILTGLTLLVAHLSEKSPQITPLVPVLSSPLMCLHVVMVMISYALLAIIMMNGIVGLFLNYRYGNIALTKQESLHWLSLKLLYPAVYLLGAGIFVGSVWANVSWGRYWGWDPKEVWALITLLIYSFALHSDSIKSFRKPVFFHAFNVISFLCVLMTFLGVNYFLGGLHSYA